MTEHPSMPGSPGAQTAVGDSSSESAFWAWFRENLPLIENFDRNQDQVLEVVRDQLDMVHQGLTFELGLADDGFLEFIVSADGVRERFPEVIRLVRAAPGIEGWRIIAFRPRSGTDSELTFAGIRLTADMLWFTLEADDGVPGLVLFIDGLDDEDEDLVMGAVFLMLDMALGEYDVETKLGYIESHSMPENPDHLGLHPFHELPAEVDRFFGETVH